MKLLKIILILFIYTTLAFSQSLSGLKICIDPGHGGHTSDDRPPVAGSTFWESDGNWYKSQHAKEILTSLGAEVFVTRSGNNDSDDPSLSVRAGIANANNVDLFHSIHSNATGTANRVNFTLVLYRGYDDAPVFPAAKTYATKVYRNFEKVNHVEDKSWDVIRGDWSFYPSWGTSGLGVLRPLIMPGVLSEGSFHDYVPEARRLKNNEYLRHEAWAITRSMLEHFNAGALTTGNLAGILRDPFVAFPTEYQPIASLGDTKMPVNNVTARLEPGNHIYNGDDHNNGYYYFENLAPGQYTLYYEAENYAVDSADITIYANQSTFLHKNLTLVPNESNPTVVETVPANEATNYSNAANIEVEFDINMDVVSTEAAFSITPAVAGTFEWEDNQKRLIFNPNSNLTAGTSYQVKIANTAKTIFDKFLPFGYTFQFSTRAKLNMISAYPSNGATNISSTVEVRIQFDQAINAGTLGGNISFEDSTGKFITPVVDMTGYAKGIISFVPASTLKLGATYRVVIGENIGDIEGVTFQENVVNEFTVTSEDFPSGVLIDDFETAGNWKTPQNSGSTNIDASSSFAITGSSKLNGSFAGELNYVFNSTDGIFRVSRNYPITLGNNQSVFGIWVKGNLSQNILKYYFKDANNNPYSKEVDTLNFTGWKMLFVKLSDVANEDLSFDGVGIIQTEIAPSSGKIFIDDAQYDFTTPVQNEFTSNPVEYSLSQNYPNPFNPSTIIRYSIPLNVKSEMSNTKLVVFDILGREVAVLVNKQQKAGNYEVSFDATNLTSGIYFYSLQSGDFYQSRKMLLLK